MRQSSSFTERRRLKRILVGLGIIIVLVLAIWGISALSRLSFLNINSIQILGVDQKDIPTLQSAIDSTLNGNYATLFSRRNTIIYPRDEIGSLVKSMYPQAEKVDIYRDGLRQIVVSISHKTPSAIVCPRLPDLEAYVDNTEPCYFVDKTGYIFEQVPLVPGQVYNKYYAPDIEDPVIDKYATSTPEFIQLQNMYEGAKAASIPVEGILISEKGEYEMYVEKNREIQSDIIVINFNNSRSMADELSNLIPFWQHLVSTSEKKNATTTLQSISTIDIRYGSNIFYR